MGRDYAGSKPSFHAARRSSISGVTSSMPMRMKRWPRLSRRWESRARMPNRHGSLALALRAAMWASFTAKRCARVSGSSKGCGHRSLRWFERAFYVRAYAWGTHMSGIGRVEPTAPSWSSPPTALNDRFRTELSRRQQHQATTEACRKQPFAGSPVPNVRAGPRAARWAIVPQAQRQGPAATSPGSWLPLMGIPDLEMALAPSPSS